MTFNFCKAFSDFLVNFALTNGVNFQSPHATEAIVPELLRTVWEEHQPQGKDAVLWEIMQQASVSGDAFIKVAYEDAFEDPAGNEHPARIRILPLNSAFCVDDQTEIRTRRGWLRHDQVALSDKAWCISPESGMGSWEPILSLQRFLWDGPLIRWQHELIDALMTPEHRCPVFTEMGGCTFKRADSITDDDEILVYSTGVGTSDGDLPTPVTVRGKDLEITSEHYTGWVWCPTTSTGTWTARRAASSGKEVMQSQSETSHEEHGSSGRQICYITGNCFP